MEKLCNCWRVVGAVLTCVSPTGARRPRVEVALRNAVASRHTGLRVRCELSLPPRSPLFPR